MRARNPACAAAPSRSTWVMTGPPPAHSVAIGYRRRPMTKVMSTAAARNELSDFEGRLVGPDDADYEDVRAVYNGMIDRRPALIAQCAGPDDVGRAVRLRRDHR